MNAGQTIETERLLIRPWTLSEQDRHFFHHINSDEAVMRFYPYRWSREQSDEMLERLHPLVERDGFGWAAACLKATGEPIGFAGLSSVMFEAAFAPAVEIGWRLCENYWGHGYATEAAAALLEYGFDTLGMNEIVSYAVESNVPSIAVMKRIGMLAAPTFDFDHPNVPDTFPHLKRHAFFRLSREDWRRNGKGRT